MSLITSYSSFRVLFAAPGAPLAFDGLPEWPYATHVRANSIPEIVCAETFDPYLVAASINDFVVDTVENVHEFDWFVSQRTSDSAGMPFTVAFFQTFEAGSGSIRFQINPWADALYPNPFHPNVVELLWGNIWLYCRRRSDGAIQVLDLYRCIVEHFVSGGA